MMIDNDKTKLQQQQQQQQQQYTGRHQTCVYKWSRNYSRKNHRQLCQSIGSGLANEHVVHKRTSPPLHIAVGRPAAAYPQGIYTPKVGLNNGCTIRC